MDGLPWRGPGPGRPQLSLPPEPMPLRRHGRLRKRWRYVGVFAEELMFVAARVRVGPIGQTFWALLDRSTGELIESTKLRLPAARGQVWSEGIDRRPWKLGMDADGLITRVDGGALTAKLTFGSGPWVEAICPTPEDNYTWTRKRAGIPIAVDIRRGEERWRFEGRGIEDESAGYHPRHTVWSWSAGIGEAADGRALAWNLVSGVNDPPERSERAIWVDGVAGEPGPVRFDDDLGGIDLSDGSRLEFNAEAERTRQESKPLISSSYRQPFGTFTGSLAGIDLASAIGVMEFHEARW